ncbi:hypothetical protein GHT06_007135 [Daphnia sinensis]|uniref:Uncharacterized protein n=1 Tax=Daphnia sinensis TaxID=1820382 RepID=A0AAD5KF91_9CRUS|nr:hypothetical protein GHT06_007135 [Daphnia sinensis]
MECNNNEVSSVEIPVPESRTYDDLGGRIQKIGTTARKSPPTPQESQPAVDGPDDEICVDDEPEGQRETTQDTPMSPDSEGENSWEQGYHLYRRKIEEKTIILADQLNKQVLSDDWKNAINTLKLILDLDPIHRHPPLYGWYADDWEPVQKKSRREDGNQDQDGDEKK